MKAEFSRLENIVRGICDDRPVYYIPNPGNWGDALIRCGTHKFFHDIGINYTEVEPWADMQSSVQDGSVLIYGGGGAWCRLWQHGRTILEPIHHLFHQIIVLPSTYETPYSLCNTTFFCRDRYESQGNMPEAVFCHDMAFYLEPASPQPAESLTGYFFRTDEESAHKHPIPAENNDISLRGTYASDVTPFFEAISRFEVVHTDRLHVAIAACLLARELHFYPGLYFKNRAVFDSSIQSYYDRVHFYHHGRQTQLQMGATRPEYGSPTVSVIIPTYQRAHWVTEAIESVFAQTYDDYEIIVINDGSTDNTREVLAQYGDKILVIQQDNQGLSAARNAGIRVAMGKYIALLDDDDLWLPHKLEKQIPFLEANPDVGLLFSDAYYYGPGAVASPYAQHVGIPSVKTIETLFAKNYVNVPTVVMRRDCLDEVGLFDESLNACEDYDMWLRIVERWRIEYLDELVANYRVSDANMSKDGIRMYLTLLRTKEKAFARSVRVRNLPLSDLDTHFYGYYVSAGIFFLERGQFDLARQVMARYLNERGRTYTYQHLMARIDAADPPSAGTTAVGSHPKPQVSVIMPVHNAGVAIHDAIQSIQAQTFPAWELIVVDAGSTDSTKELVAQYSRQNNRIRLVNGEEVDLTAARRRGVALAQGDYIYCLAAYYRSQPEALQRLYAQFLIAPEAVAVYGAVACMNPVGAQQGQAPASSSDASPIELLAYLVAEEHFLNMGAIAIRRAQLTDENSLIDLDLDDETLWWLLAAKGAVAYVDGGPLSVAG
jgi:glycosyltransferase involved in cell wall biosynthesis